MVRIPHFKHNHPLIILEQAPSWLSDDDKKNITCHGCHKPLPWAEDGEDVYACATCEKLFLHESCVEFPREICHSYLERHTFLLRRMTNLHPLSLMYCIVCRYNKKEALIYESKMDAGFTLHIKCAFEESKNVVVMDNDLTLNHHPSHKHHTLRLHARLSSFDCDALCGFEGKDFSYHCVSCSYSIHRRCAVLPYIKNSWDDHNHPLSLSLGLPSGYPKTIRYLCAVCLKEIVDTTETQSFIYICYSCRYVVHSNCMTREKLIKRGRLVVDDDQHLLHLPAADNSVELIQPFLLQQNINILADVQSEVRIFSHKQHPLILSHEHNFRDNNEDDEGILCDACIEPILSPPYYNCAKCSYFLHLHCANLPREFNSPDHHHHSLILGSRTRFYENFRCNLCARFSNGFYYFCEVKGCEFYIDVKCAVLPDLIIHDSHNYPQQWLREVMFFSCRACNIDFDFSTWFGSTGSPFMLHVKCALLPGTVRHKFDKHPLRLRFPPHNYHPQPFDCAQCEKEIDRMYWLYHCMECDTSFHVHCVHRTGELGSYKCGQKLQIDIHPHPLRFVRRASINSPCHRCEEDINKDLAFECETCNFHLCRSCVLAIEP